MLTQEQSNTDVLFNHSWEGENINSATWHCTADWFHHSGFKRLLQQLTPPATHAECRQVTFSRAAYYTAMSYVQGFKAGLSQSSQSVRETDWHCKTNTFFFFWSAMMIHLWVNVGKTNPQSIRDMSCQIQICWLQLLRQFFCSFVETVGDLVLNCWQLKYNENIMNK